MPPNRTATASKQQAPLQAYYSPHHHTAAHKEPRTAGEMGASLMEAVAALVSTCTRRLQRAARRMGAGKSAVVAPWRKAFSLPTSAGKGKARAGREDEGGLWRKEILMGERCQPLEFSGVIYYDADGHLLAQPPRSPMRSPLPASFKRAANAGALH